METTRAEALIFAWRTHTGLYAGLSAASIVRVLRVRREYRLLELPEVADSIR